MFGLFKHGPKVPQEKALEWIRYFLENHNEGYFRLTCPDGKRFFQCWKNNGEVLSHFPNVDWFKPISEPVKLKAESYSFTCNILEPDPGVEFGFLEIDFGSDFKSLNEFTLWLLKEGFALESKEKVRFRTRLQ